MLTRAACTLVQGLSPFLAVNDYSQTYIWKKNLSRELAGHIGGELKRKGVNIALGLPMVGLLGRVARGERNWEGFSNDSYHFSRLGGLSVQAVQDQGVNAVVKHFVGNERERSRNVAYDSHDLTVRPSSANMDDATIHELYVWPFYDAAPTGVAAVMCSYKSFNNSDAYQNSKAPNGILKGELGY